MYSVIPCYLLACLLYLSPNKRRAIFASVGSRGNMFTESLRSNEPVSQYIHIFVYIFIFYILYLYLSYRSKEQNKAESHVLTGSTFVIMDKQLNQKILQQYLLA